VNEHQPSAESRVIHAGTQRHPGAPASPPLVLASVYASWGEPDPPRAYGRGGNPSWEALEQALGIMEDAEAVAFASGQAASMALMLALAEGRRQVLLPHDGYYNTRMLADQLRPHGAVPVPADLLDHAQVKHHLAAGPSVLWAETPTNPLLRVADLAGLARLASAADAPMIVDNTVATGLLQKPLDLGAAASLCSLTKAASGHSDVLLGAVLTRDPGLLGDLRNWRAVGGGIPGPFESWLALRGLKRPAPRHSSAGPRGPLPGHERGNARSGQQADAPGIRPVAVVRGGRHRRRDRRRGEGRTDHPARDQLRGGGVSVGAARPVVFGDGTRITDPAVGRHRAGR
jgi:cystathionine beta-lyase/cystathionine gamma-synthase